MPSVIRNAAGVIRDPAHAIRIAIQKPMQLQDTFGDVYEELMGKQDGNTGHEGLIPQIQHSDKLKRMLQAMEQIASAYLA